jgi:hypothetical protein
VLFALVIAQSGRGKLQNPTVRRATFVFEEKGHSCSKKKGCEQPT